ncbi:hypothetical protein ABBQ38_001851 [Trebouxia sp. C0009 RCD-2024]
MPDLVQVQGTCNPDWAPISWSDDASQHLRTQCVISIHVYAYCLPGTAHERPAPGHILPRQPADKQEAANHIAVQQEPPRQPFSTDESAASSQVSTAVRTALILSAEVNLDELHPFQDDLAALDVCLPPNTLVLELSDGLCLFPSLTASSDLSHLSNKAAVRIPVLPGSPARPDQAMTELALPDAGFLTEQTARQQLAESLLHKPITRAPTPTPVTPVTPDVTPEVGRLRGLVRSKLGFAFGSGPDLEGMNSPSGASPMQQARLASASQASFSGRPDRVYKVEVAELDARMVTLAQRQRELQAALDRKQKLSDQLTQALQHRNTARQQQLRLEALRHARKQHEGRCDAVLASISGVARSKDLAHTILQAQLRSLRQALNTLKAAYGRLDTADLVLKGPQGRMQYRPLHAQLVGRRCRMACSLATVYAVGPQTVTVCQAPPQGFLEDQLERGWWAGSEAGSSCGGSPKALVVSQRRQPATAKNGFRQAALLTIGGLDLDPLLGRGGLDGIMNWEGDKQEMRRVAAALGYLASVVERLGFYLDVPLRYPIKPGNCKTVILGHGVTAGSYRSIDDSSMPEHTMPVGYAQSAFKCSATSTIPEFPLYCEGVDRARFAYAIYLLNKGSNSTHTSAQQKCEFYQHHSHTQHY